MGKISNIIQSWIHYLPQHVPTTPVKAQPMQVFSNIEINGVLVHGANKTLVLKLMQCP